MQKSSPEIINDGKWIFSKLINARAEASRWFNDCLLGINLYCPKFREVQKKRDKNKIKVYTAPSFGRCKKRETKIK